MAPPGGPAPSPATSAADTPPPPPPAAPPPDAPPSTAAVPPEDAVYETPAAQGRFAFRWDALVRYDAILLDRQAPVADIHRWRTEVRPELDWMPTERLKLGVRLVGDLGSDSDRTNAARFDNYRSNGGALDLAFVEFRPGIFSIHAGQFSMPFRTSEMFWDRDIPVLGGAASARLPIGATSAVTLTGGLFYGPQRQEDDSHIAAAQATWEVGDPARVAFDVSGSYWRFTQLARVGAEYLRQNEPAGYGPPPPPGNTIPVPYANDFRIIDTLARVRAGGGWKFPISLSFDWVHNLAAEPSEYRDGVEAALRVGREGTPGDVQVFEIFQYVDRDALVGAYNTDDWWFHTWYRGHRVGFSVTILPQVEIRPSVVFQRRLDRQHYLNRYLLDLVKTF